MNNSSFFDLIVVGAILIVIIVIIILRFKCPQLFRKAKAPDKCEKCWGREFIPVYSKAQKINTERVSGFAVGGPIAFKCGNCGSKIKVKKGEGFLTSGDLGKPHA